MAKASGTHGMVTLSLPWRVGINFTRFLSASGFFFLQRHHRSQFTAMISCMLVTLALTPFAKCQADSKTTSYTSFRSLFKILVNLMLGGTDDAESLIVSAPLMYPQVADDVLATSTCVFLFDESISTCHTDC